MLGIGTIKDWAIMWDRNRPFVAGLIYGHPTFEDGTLIYSSAIVGADGRNIVTMSGSCYELTGDPIEPWTTLYKETYPEFDPDNPVKEFYKNDPLTIQ